MGLGTGKHASGGSHEHLSSHGNPPNPKPEAIFFHRRCKSFWKRWGRWGEKIKGVWRRGLSNHNFPPFSSLLDPPKLCPFLHHRFKNVKIVRNPCAKIEIQQFFNPDLKHRLDGFFQSGESSFWGDFGSNLAGLPSIKATLNVVPI